MIQLSTGVVFLLSSMYGPGNLQANAAAAYTAPPLSEAPFIVQDRKSVENYLRTEYADTPILVDIARCESTFAQFDKDGNVIRGRVNPNDVGVMQINEKYHAEKAKELGYDLHTIEGNVAYAKYLYANEGTTPWNSSAPCWKSKDIAKN